MQCAGRSRLRVGFVAMIGLVTSLTAFAAEPLEARRMLAAGTVSEQIIVDQFGWRASSARKVVLFADPINGQNSAVAYTPGTSFQVRRVSDDAVVFTGASA